MTEETLPRTEFAAPHDGCLIKVSHQHVLKRVLAGYVLDNVILTDVVIKELLEFLESDQVEKRQFAARNLRDSSPALTLTALIKALDREDDAFTAGILISALGSLKRREAVKVIQKWVPRADEGFVAQNILDSYLQIWTDTQCEKDKGDQFCYLMHQIITSFTESINPLVAAEALRLTEILTWHD